MARAPELSGSLKSLPDNFPLSLQKAGQDSSIQLGAPPSTGTYSPWAKTEYFLVSSRAEAGSNYLYILRSLHCTSYQAEINLKPEQSQLKGPSMAKPGTIYVTK